MFYGGSADVPHTKGHTDGTQHRSPPRREGRLRSPVRQQGQLTRWRGGVPSPLRFWKDGPMLVMRVDAPPTSPISFGAVKQLLLRAGLGPDATDRRLAQSLRLYFPLDES